MKVDEASEIKNRQLCIVGAHASGLMAKDSRLMTSYESTNDANREWVYLSSRLYSRLMVGLVN